MDFRTIADVQSHSASLPPHLDTAVQDALASSVDRDKMIIVHHSRLFRDCLKQALNSSVDFEIADFSTLDDALAQVEPNSIRLLIIGLQGNDWLAERSKLDAIFDCLGEDVPLVATGDSEDPRFVVNLLNKGVRGYIPASLELQVTLQALALVLAGGVYAPASCLLKLWQNPTSETEQAGDLRGLTNKQLAVIEAIRQGKANKTIAYELNMCESTVKVHVRNIMKKLQAKNRTQVAYIANKMLQHVDA
ncbi:MAG: response regulator transcription factor [Pseudomonadota bacterium]